jgi:hypothetical protein
MGVMFILFLFAALIGLVGGHGLRAEISNGEFAFSTLAGFACATIAAWLIFKDAMLEAMASRRADYRATKWYVWAGVIAAAWVLVGGYVIRALA